MKECKTCVNWGTPNEKNENVLNRTCEMITTETHDYPPEEDGILAYVDEEHTDFYAKLKTAPNFGCVLHEESV